MQYLSLIIDPIKDAGAFVFLVIIWGIIGIGLNILQLVWFRKYNLLPLIMGSIGITLLLGIIGFVSGEMNLIGILENMQESTDDFLHTGILICRGTVLSLNPLLYAVVIAGGLQCILWTVTWVIRVNKK